MKWVNQCRPFEKVILWQDGIKHTHEGEDSGCRESPMSCYLILGVRVCVSEPNWLDQNSEPTTSKK